MLSVQPNSALYRLCDQTVTHYHNADGVITRTVIAGAHLDWRKTRNVDKTGSKDASSFLLVVPADRLPAGGILPLDKVIAGTGPEVADRAAWSAFIPASVPGLVVVKYVDPKYWSGKLTHVEAGG